MSGEHDIATIEGESSPLVQAGVYTVEYVGHKTWMFHQKRPKLSIVFRIIDKGDFYGVHVCRHYNLKRVKKEGGFSAGRSSNFYREYFTLFGEPARPDRIPMSAFKGEWIKAKIDTVKKDGQGRPLHEALQYSVIQELFYEEE